MPVDSRDPVGEEPTSQGDMDGVVALPRLDEPDQLGHKNLEMTLVYARIADRTVADEYFDVSTKVDHLYSNQLPADAEGPNMQRLRQQHQRTVTSPTQPEPGGCLA